MGIICSLSLPRNRNRNIKLTGVRFKARKRKQLFTQVADWWNSLPADAADTRSPRELRESKISTQKKDLNWVIIQTTDSGNPLMWKWRAWVRIRGKHHICLHSSYSSLGVHFWRQTVPLFSWSVLLAPCLVGLSSWTGAQLGIGQNSLFSNTDSLQQPAQVRPHHHGWQAAGGGGVPAFSLS